MRNYSEMESELSTLKNCLYTELATAKCSQYFITFKYLLPFKIPVRNNEKFIFEITKRKKYLFYFSQSEFNIPNVYMENKTIYTYVEATMLVSTKNFKKLKANSNNRNSRIAQLLTKIFDEQLEILNDFLKLIILKYQYHNIYTVTLGHILNIPISVLYNKSGQIFNGQLFLIRQTNKIENDQKETLKSEELQILTSNFHQLINHPSKIYTLWMRRGERAFFNSDYNESIINTQTAIEVFVKDFVEKFKVQIEHLDEKKVNNIIEGGYKNLLYDHLAKIIANKLILKNHIEIFRCIDRYYNVYYPMRNDIVHRGKEYKKNDAKAFQDIISDLIRMITYNMHKLSGNVFIEEFKKYNIINEEIKIDSIIQKYRF